MKMMKMNKLYECKHYQNVSSYVQSKKKNYLRTRPLPRYLSPSAHYKGRNTFPEIFTLFHFPQKSTVAAKSGENRKFSTLHRTLLCYPFGKKIRSKSLYLLRFLKYSHFSIFRKNPRWLPKVAWSSSRGEIQSQSGSPNPNVIS